MTPAVIGALIGLGFALVEYVMFGILIRRARERGETGFGPRALDIARMVQLVLFPVVGYVAGPYVAAALGG